MLDLRCGAWAPEHKGSVVMAHGLSCPAARRTTPQQRVVLCAHVPSHVWLLATLQTVTHQAPLSMEFSRQEYWSGFPFPSPGDLPNPGIKPGFPALQANSLPSEPPPESPALEDRFLNTGPPGNSPKTFSKVRKLQAWTHYIYTYMSMCMCVLVAQSCPTLCDSSDCNSPGSSVHGILQATVLEWVAMPSSRGSSWPRDRS